MPHSSRHPAYEYAHGPEAAGNPILVVDDDEAIRMVAQVQLRAAGYAVALADGARSAMSILDSSGHGTFCLLITDIVMPETSGVELAQRFQRQWPDAPVLLMSGYTDDVITKGGRSWSILHKPFTAECMLSAVRAALAGETPSR